MRAKRPEAKGNRGETTLGANGIRGETTRILQEWSTYNPTVRWSDKCFISLKVNTITCVI